MFKDRVAIVTGGGRGIGFAIAKKLAEQNCNIALLDIGEYVTDAAAELEKMGVKAKGYISDVTSTDKTKETVDQVAKDFGKIDFLVNNAGVTQDTLVMRMTEKQWDLVLDVCAKGTFNMSKAVFRYMMKAKFGRIVNISSIVGLTGNAGQANYSAAKAGVIGLTKANAKEFGGKNITVNAICPGLIPTDMTKDLPDAVKQGYIDQCALKFHGSVDDIAGGIKFFLSEDAKWITGVIMRIDGGAAIGM